MVFKEAGDTLEGNELVERSARPLHAPVHLLKGAKVVVHPRPPWALAFEQTQSQPLPPATQKSAFLDGTSAVDDHWPATSGPSSRRSFSSIPSNA